MDRNFTCRALGDIVKDSNGNPYTCLQTDVLTSAQISIIKNTIVPEAYARLQGFLSVLEPVQGTMVFPSGSCYPYANQTSAIPTNYTTVGVTGYDLVVFVTGRPVPPACVTTPSSPCNPTAYEVIAFAGECIVDTNTSRTVAGYMNFNPGLLPTTAAAVTDATYSTTVHELTHVLGFTSSKMYEFFDPSTRSVRPYSWVVANSPVNAAWQVVVTPNVVSEVRAHFGCGNLTGALLEYAGSGSTAGSHWERLAFYNEYMTGQTNYAASVSRITLALLNDMGWYSANMSKADPLLWGYQQGCPMATGLCTGLPLGGAYRCTDPNLMRCNADRTAKAHCMVPTTPALLTGMCSFVQGWSNGYCNVLNNDPPMLVSDHSGEVFGESSRCYDSTLTTDSLSADPSQGCYATVCAGPTRLKLQVDGWHYNCPVTSPASTLTPLGYNGKITCPTDYLLCLNITNDVFWPEITGVSPARPQPGDVVTITGTGFTAGASITIIDTCSNPQFASSTSYSCTLPGWSVFEDPTKFKNGVNILMKDSQGRTAVLQSAFDIPAQTQITTALQWIRAYPLYTGLIAAAIFILLVVLIVAFCCWCCKGKKKVGSSDHRAATADW